MTNYTREQFIIDMFSNELTAEQHERAEEWLAARADITVNTVWLRDHVGGISAAQKAAMVLSVAAELGLVDRCLSLD